MAYCTQSDVQDEVGGQATLEQLADYEEIGIVANAANVASRVSKAIAEADGVINTYLKKRHAVPLATPTPEIVALSAKWAARVMRRKRYKSGPLADDLDAEKIDREWLSDIADGTIALGVEPSPTKSDLINDKVGERDTSLLISRRKLDGLI